MDAAAFAGGFRTGHIHDFFLCVVHQNHGFRNPLAHHGAGGDGAVGVEHFHPVVIDNAGAFGIDFANPHIGAAAKQREHTQVVAIGAVDAPFLVRGEEIEGDFRVAVVVLAEHFFGGFEVHRRAVHTQAFAKRAHPQVILVKLLAAGEGAPRNQLVHIGVAGVVAHFFALDARPNGRGNNLARLRHHIAEADLGVLRRFGQMLVFAAGGFAQRFPGFHGNVAVGFGGEGKNHLGSINGGVELGLAFADAVGTHAVEFTQELNLMAGLPCQAFAVVVDFFQQGADAGEFLVNQAVITLHHAHGGHGFARNRVAFAVFPVFRVERLAHFLRAVVHQRGEHDVFAHADVISGNFAEFLGDAFVDFPVGFAFPQGVYRRGERVDKRVHVRRV